jgi:vancomycin resistance protein YoaR
MAPTRPPIHSRPPMLRTQRGQVRVHETTTPAQADPHGPSGPGPWTTTRDRPRRRTLAIAAGLVLLAPLAVLAAIALTRAGHPLPGTHVEGVDVSGLGEEDLRAAVTQLVRTRQDATVEVTAAGQAFTFTPGADGYGGDVDATVDAARDAGRDGPLGLVGHVRATFGAQRDVPLQGAPIERAIADFVDEVAARVDQPMDVGSVRVDPDTLEVDAAAPQDEVVLDVAGSVAALAEVVGDPDPPPVELPAEVTAPPTDQAALDDAVARAQEAVSGDLVLTANGGALTLTPSEIARVLRSEEQDGRLTLLADRESLAEIVAPDLAEVEVQPTDADFRVASGFTTFDTQGSVTWSPRPADVRVVPSEPGQLYDPEVGAAQVGRLIDRGAREAELELPTARADLTTEDAEALDIDSLIGTFTTYHACCANRVRNIHRIADIVRGQVLLPGETFSINDFVGQRTREKGFVADGAIFRGEIRDEVGGGISQFATTMYNASFFAGIPILDHRAHSLYISRYPLGREATLNYDSIDLEIENDTANGLLIHTSYTDTSITVSLFGNNGGRQVTANMGQPYDYRGFDTRTESTSELFEGQQRVVQNGADGYRVTVERVIRGGDADRTEKIVTTYEPKPKIVEYGTRKRPPPPSPSPSPSESSPKPKDPKPKEPDPTPTSSG